MPKSQKCNTKDIIRCDKNTYIFTSFQTTMTAALVSTFVFTVCTVDITQTTAATVPSGRIDEGSQVSKCVGKDLGQESNIITGRETTDLTNELIAIVAHQ